MNILTKFIIGSIISYFGSLSPAEPAVSAEQNSTPNVQKQTTAYVHVFPEKADSLFYTEFICLGK